jgi:hypothetical protein
MKKRALLFFVAISICVMTSNRVLGTDIDSRLKERIDSSDLIVIGKVTDLTSQRSENDGIIYTIATLSVEKAIKGDPRSNQIKIRVLGGSVGDMATLVFQDVADFSINERVLVFLQEVKTNREYYWVFDETEGKYSIGYDRGMHEMIVGEGVSLKTIVNQIQTYLKGSR